MIPDEQLDKMDVILTADHPGTIKERWANGCIHAKIDKLVKAGRDVTIIIGPHTDRKQGDFHVLTERQ